MNTILSKLESHLKRTNNPILDILNENNNFIEKDFVDVLLNLKLMPSKELLELFYWRSGICIQKAVSIDFDLKLFSFGTHIDYRATSSLFIVDQQTEKLFNNKYLPIIYGGILEDPIMIDLKHDSTTYGQLFYYSPNVTLSQEPMSIYDSIQSWLYTINECYEKKIYQIESDGSLISNDEETIISRKLNPNSDFWKE